MILAPQTSVNFEEFVLSPDYRDICERLTSLPDRCAALVDLDRQGFNESTIQIPDVVQARLDRQEVPPYLLRKALIVSAGLVEGRPLINPGEIWLVHPSEGQWWSSQEVESLGFQIPKNFQLRLYGVHTELTKQIYLKCST